MDFEHAGAEVENPVVRDSRAGICHGFAAAGETQTRLSDLNDERRARRMRGGVVAWRTPDDADIRLGLGPIIENDGALSLNEPALSESELEGLRCACGSSGGPASDNGRLRQLDAAHGWGDRRGRGLMLTALPRASNPHRPESRFVQLAAAAPANRRGLRARAGDQARRALAAQPGTMRTRLWR
jgi:hypothetical protein